MAEAILEKPACANCGAEVRPDTQFCYNCGKQLDEDPPPIEKPADLIEPAIIESEKNESLADLEKALAASRVNAEDPRSKLEAAARERRKARVAQRRPIEITWNAGNGPNWAYLAAVAVIFLLVLMTVLLTVFWK